jgi:transposase InsO family protein
MYPVELMCKYMLVSKNAYYHWLKNESNKSMKSATSYLKEKIKFLFYENKEIYGSYRIKKQLERENLYYSRSYIGLLMREMGLKSILKRKFTITTNSNHSYSIAKNVLNREFTHFQLGQKWVSDITYIRVNNDWNYLTTIIDLADRKVVGWSLSEDMTTENTVLKAYTEA